MKKRKIEIMDTTLRDGEQTSGVSFSAAEKLTIAKLLLEELHVDRIEIASARVSEGEFQAVKNITEWAKKHGYLNQVEILTFVDGGQSIDWMKRAGAKVQNLLTKGSLNHLTHQLKKTPEQHFAEIKETIESAQKEGIATNVYLEDWSNGMRNSQEYVFQWRREGRSLGRKRSKRRENPAALVPGWNQIGGFPPAGGLTGRGASG